jgi:cytochrome c
MDSFEVNKILGAVLGTLTVTMGLMIGSEILFDAHQPEKPGYELAEPAEEGGGEAPVAEAVAPIAARLAQADAAKGEAVAKQCGSCHSFEKGGPNKVGPNLYGVMGASHAHLEGFSYSSAMSALKGQPWSFEAMDAFLADPRGAIQGTAMSYAGVKRPDQRANLIAYLNQNSDSPLPPPPPPAEEAAPAAGGDAAPAPAPAEGAAPAGDAPVAPAPGAGEPAPAPENTVPGGGPGVPIAPPSDAPAANDGSAAPPDGDVGGPTSVPTPQSGAAPTPATPPSGAPEGGTPELPQGGAGNEAPVQLPPSGDRQPRGQ